MSEYEEYNFDDDDDDDEEEFEKKIYIDDDDDEEEEDEEEVDNEYEGNNKRQDYSQNQEEYEEEEEEDEDEEGANDNVFVEEEDVSDYEEKSAKTTSKKRQPKKSNVETPKKKPRKASEDSIPKSIASEATTPLKMPTISEAASSVLPPFNGIPSAQENLKKKQIKDIWCYVCPLCSKTVYNKQTFERHLLLHDDFLTVLQVYYCEEDPVQCLNAAMEEWKVVETEYLKQDVEPESQKQTNFKNDVVLFKSRYYDYEAGKRLIFRKNAMESLKSKPKDLTVEERLKCAIFNEFQKDNMNKK